MCARQTFQLGNIKIATTGTIIPLAPRDNGTLFRYGKKGHERSGRNQKAESASRHRLDLARNEILEWQHVSTNQRESSAAPVPPHMGCLYLTATGFSAGGIPSLQWNHHRVWRWPSASTLPPSWQKQSQTKRNPEKAQLNEIILNHHQYNNQLIKWTENNCAGFAMCFSCNIYF